MTSENEKTISWNVSEQVTKYPTKGTLTVSLTTTLVSHFLLYFHDFQFDTKFSLFFSGTIFMMSLCEKNAIPTCNNCYCFALSFYTELFLYTCM